MLEGGRSQAKMSQLSSRVPIVRAPVAWPDFAVSLSLFWVELVVIHRGVISSTLPNKRIGDLVLFPEKRKWLWDYIFIFFLDRECHSSLIKKNHYVRRVSQIHFRVTLCRIESSEEAHNYAKVWATAFDRRLTWLKRLREATRQHLHIGD